MARTTPSRTSPRSSWQLGWSPTRIWLGIFGFWLFLLSGFTHEVGVGSPGLFQFVQLNALLKDRQAEVLAIEAEIAKLDGESQALQTSRTVQEREIRKTMGYVGENEMIFDFSQSQSASLRR